MDHPNTPHTPMPQPTQLPSQTTPTPTLNNFLQAPLYSVGLQAPAAQGSFTVPMISPADWYRLNTLTPLIHTMPLQPSPQPPNPEPSALPPAPKRRDRPRKVRPIKTAANTLPSTSPATPDVEILSEATTQLCWFMPHEDGKSDMDLVAGWCSNFENFTEWRTRPKQPAGEKVSSFIVSQGHPKREPRECEKKVSFVWIWPLNICMMLTPACMYVSYRSGSLRTGLRPLRPSVTPQEKVVWMKRILRRERYHLCLGSMYRCQTLSF